MKFSKYHALGNDYIVIGSEEIKTELSRDAVRCICHRNYGPLIEVEPRFPNRTNVQFMRVLDRNSIQIEIWERGAGYTLASGSSSTAAAAVALKLGFCDPEITVHMPGGSLRIQFANGFCATMTGPVTKICEGVMANEMFGL